MAMPSRKPTPTEWKIVVYMLIVILAVGGVFLLWGSGRMPADQQEMAKEMFRNGWYFIGGSVLGVIILKVIKHIF